MRLGDTMTAERDGTLEGKRHFIRSHHREVVWHEPIDQAEPQDVAAAEPNPFEEAYKQAFDHLMKRWDQKGIC